MSAGSGVLYRRATLPNGLRVVAEIDPGAHTAAVGYFVNTGARDEDAAAMGVSHFLEHMMFKGTAEKSADEVNQAFDDFGADYNAFTSHERTVYYAHVLPEFLEPATDLLGEILRPSLRGADFDVEKKVILEEIGMYDDRPEWVLQDRLLERHFAHAGPGGRLHGGGFRVLGTAQTVGALTPERMRAYFDRRYSPGNVAVAAAGNLDFDRLVGQVAARCGGWPAVDTARDLSAPALPAGVRRFADTDADLSRHYLGLICPGPAASDPRRHAAAVLAVLLGDSDNSRLHWALVDPGLADEASASFQAADGRSGDPAGSFMAWATCDPGRAAEVEAKLLETVDGVVAAPDFSEADVAAAVNKAATGLTLLAERPAGRMHRLGSQLLALGENHGLDEQLAALRAVTPDAIASLVADFPWDPRTVAVLGPNG
ncbi:M16 family metallopeptidase [Phycisphaera mikurensis]|uniref:Putative M16 family peptidase n=1 Tax=Phycisphaera mikurensis (strain NBRC 102666 / KCTC 22515 / FYK2301M01) TaxID=1142394 RepID=I0IBK2_PHYMF|nr:pitrilysin family protein [Phycisphaera mikurensis]MBB6442830.1 putative Zn-dependent peptidase [Phycisphaera mikurensis]BAM02640.1 putative M16 family peptidase [Phycisphaera mikurensis NBRC 102666]